MAFTPAVTWNGGTSSATGFNASPAGSADPRQGDDRIRELKVALAERLTREHFFALAGGSSAGQEGNLRAGAGRIYHQSSAPTTKPDGNALNADDVGRMYAQSNTTPLYVRTSNNTWVKVRADPFGGTSSKANFVFTTDGTNLQCKVIQIGDWNMDTTASVKVAHGIDSTKLVSMTVMIRCDSGAVAYPWAPLGVFSGGGTIAAAGDFAIDSSDNTKVFLERVTGGAFDGPSYDATSYNRGFITIWYTP